MSPEQTPPNRSDDATTLAKDKLRRFVMALILSEDSTIASNGSRLHTTQLGNHLIMEASYFRPPKEEIKPELLEMLPEHILKLAIYNGGEFVESVAISDGDEGTLLADAAKKERDYLDPDNLDDANTHITEFFKRNNLNGMYNLLSEG